MTVTQGFRRTRSFVECRLGLEDFAVLVASPDGADITGILRECEGVLEVNYGPPWLPIISVVPVPPMDGDADVLALDRLVSWHLECCRIAAPDGTRLAARFTSDALICRNGCADMFGAMALHMGEWVVTVGHHLGDVLASFETPRGRRSAGVQLLSFVERETAEATLESELGPQSRVLFDTRAASQARPSAGYQR
jgi:hypothetical protein